MILQWPLLKRLHTVDVRAEVNLADVVVLQHRGVSSVGSVVSGAVVEGAAGGEGQAGVESVLLDQLTGAFLQSLTGRERGKKGGRRETRLFTQRKETRRTLKKETCGGHSLTRSQSWSFRAAWSCGHAGGPVCALRPPVGSRSTSPRWPCPGPASRRDPSATLHCDFRGATGGMGRGQKEN